MDYRKLKSGTDLRGVAVGDRADLTPDVAFAFGRAFARRVSELCGKPAEQVTIALGRDSRISGCELLDGAARGVASAGSTALDYGMCTTPAMYMALLQNGDAPDASIMVTASHHPWDRNGLKFFEQDGGIEGKELDVLIRMAEEEETASDLKGSIVKAAFLPSYTESLKKLIIDTIDPEISKPLLGLHVVVDAGNGAGGFYENMLSDLGAWTEGSQFLEPDGHFPNHIPNPENETAMESISKAVKNVGADLGVIFDADCDRAAIVDENGRTINRNRLIALISAILLEEKPGQTIVTDSVTSTGLANFIKEWGGEHYRYKRGYRNVIDEAKRLNAAGIDCPLAIETSGHAALRSNHFLDDGMYLVTLLIIKALQMKQKGETLAKLLEDLREPVESSEIRLPLTGEDFVSNGRSLVEYVLDYSSNHPDWHVAPDNREGVRISFDVNDQLDSAWFLLRLSLHDPVMPLNAESDVPGGVKYVLSRLYEAVLNWEGIDLTPLKKAVE